MKKRRFIPLLVLLSLIAVTAMVYFLVLPQVTFLDAVFEQRQSPFLYLKMASRGYRLKMVTLGPQVLDNPETLEETLKQCDTQLLVLSSAVSYFTKETNFVTDEDGPVTIAFLEDSSKDRFDVVFSYSTISGWDDAAAFIAKKGLAATVINPIDDPIAEAFTDLADVTIADYDQTSIRVPSTSADIICCPYVENFANIIERNQSGKWIVDSSMVNLVHVDLLEGSIQDDIFSSLESLLDSGIRHSETMTLPVQRHLVLNRKAIVF